MGTLRWAVMIGMSKRMVRCAGLGIFETRGISKSSLRISDKIDCILVWANPETEIEVDRPISPS